MPLVYFKRMSIDEPLDRLTEHEALTQSVELMMHQQREWFEASQAWQETSQAWQEKSQISQDKNQVLIAQILESVNGLARIAHAHERRLTNLEGGRQ